MGFFAVIGLSVFSLSASAQGRAPAPFRVHQLTPNVYWVEGGGGKSGVIVADKGVIVVDAKTNPAGGKELVDDIAKITPKPITTVILTHSDADHVNGVVAFPAGIRIIAHQNCRKEPGTYPARPRTPGRDVDRCFGGSITVSRLTL